MLGLGNSVSASQYPGGWTPASISGLVGWYRFNTGLQKSGGAFPSNGDGITQWDDASGQGNNATKSSNLATYDSTLKGPDFQGGSDSLQIPQLELEEFAVYVRIRFTDSTIDNNDILAQDDDTSGNFFRIQTTTSIRTKLGGSGATNYTLHSSTTLTANTYYILGLERQTDGEVFSYLDGTANGSSQTIAFGGSPSRNFLVDEIKGGNNAIVSEVIIANKSLSDGDRAELTTWMAAEIEG